MKTVFQQLFSRKMIATAAAGLVVLMGFVGAGKFLQSHQSINVARCTLPSGQACGTPSPNSSGFINQPITIIAQQDNSQQSALKKGSGTRSKVPAPAVGLKATPTQTPVLTPTSSPVSPSSVEGMIDQVFGSYAAGAVSVARCESGLNPNAYNPTSIGGSHAAGVFQILYPSTWDGTSEAASSPYNAMANINAAHEIFTRDGNQWSAWSCKP